jgi:hypothetical protein
MHPAIIMKHSGTAYITPELRGIIEHIVSRVAQSV